MNCRACLGFAQEFIPNPDNKLRIDRIDRNRLNNVVDNLRWVSTAEIYNNAKKRLWKALALKLKAIRKAHKEENNLIDNLDPILNEENIPYQYIAIYTDLSEKFKHSVTEHKILYTAHRGSTCN